MWAIFPLVIEVVQYAVFDDIVVIDDEPSSFSVVRAVQAVFVSPSFAPMRIGKKVRLFCLRGLVFVFFELGEEVFDGGFELFDALLCGV